MMLAPLEDGEDASLSSGSVGMLSEINVTPLVDVMLVLLVVFIVTAPLLIPQSLGVTLPKTVAVNSPVDQGVSHLVVRADGSLRLNEQVLSTDAALVSALAEKAREPKFQLQIESDESVRYGRLAEVIALVQRAGVERLSLLTVTAQR